MIKGSRKERERMRERERERERALGLAWVFDTTKLTPSDTFSPTRPHL
jgi:hypothetical protein